MVLWYRRESMVESILSRAAKKLSFLLIQQPGLLSGIEDDVNWIYLKITSWVMDHRAFDRGFMEPSRDIAYDVEDVIDDLTLKPAARMSRGVRKKLEKIKVKVYDVSRRPVPCTMIETETVENQNIANTVVSPVIEKVTALLAKVDVIDFISGREQFRRRGTFRKVITGFDKLRFQLRLGGEMDEINARIEDLSKRRMEEINDRMMEDLLKRRPKDVIRDARNGEQGIERWFPHRQVPPSYIIGKPDIVSFDDDVKEIVARLLTDEKDFFIFSVVGMQGIGKTTLAKLVYNNDAVVDHFPYRAFVSCNYKEALEVIAKQMGIPSSWKEDNRSNVEKAEVEGLWSEEGSWSQRVKSMPLKTFLKDKKHVIVWDDIEMDVGLKILLSKLPKTSNGSRMILITRYERGLTDLQKKGIHLTLQLRDDDESWALFKHILKIDMPQGLLYLRRDIVTTCCGLPLAIKKLADILSCKDTTTEEWSSVL
eukprot:XP_010650604.2 PREDICTED: putative disease resistance RPP13-like protein 2 [Vitis vinifera]